VENSYLATNKKIMKKKTKINHLLVLQPNVYIPRVLTIDEGGQNYGEKKFFGESFFLSKPVLIWNQFNKVFLAKFIQY
jgi:hypothetical protein